MSIKTVTTFHCDVCKAIMPTQTTLKIQTIFTTEQTEGKPCAPYLTHKDLDLCELCLTKIFDGNYLFASGAQGYNTYYFKGESNAKP